MQANEIDVLNAYLSARGGPELDFDFDEGDNCSSHSNSSSGGGPLTTTRDSRTKRTDKRKQSQVCRANRLKQVAVMQKELVHMTKRNVELELELAQLRKEGDAVRSRIDRLKALVASSMDLNVDLFFPEGA